MDNLYEKRGDMVIICSHHFWEGTEEANERMRQLTQIVQEETWLDVSHWVCYNDIVRVSKELSLTQEALRIRMVEAVLSAFRLWDNWIAIKILNLLNNLC